MGKVLPAPGGGAEATESIGRIYDGERGSSGGFLLLTRRSVRAATLTAFVLVAAVTALLPAGAGAADGEGAKTQTGPTSSAKQSGSRTSTAGSGTATLFGSEVSGGPCGVALDPAVGKVYWTNFISGEIRAANLDASGTPLTLFTEGLKRRSPARTRRGVRPATLTALVFVAAVTALLPAGAGAADGAGARIYWSNESGAIRFANLDGSGRTTLFGGEVVAPVGSRLIPQPARSTGRTSSRERSGWQTWTGPAPPRPSSPKPATRVRCRARPRRREDLLGELQRKLDPRREPRRDGRRRNTFCRAAGKRSEWGRDRPRRRQDLLDESGQ